ncbi:deleted in malignant brain tumors 1 protein-like [Ylistrum balloti]|uniref:deleted in malignant brain tumors 1 protein-like n=1 Tax=Ylistrum balloti TaxID=509963 RepID=UPI002905F587|nr:deleted in malignant brain tumors 1 protein-like [Ylistrum balloti]
MTTFDYWSSSLGGSMIVGQGINFRLYGNLLEVYHDGRWGTVCDDGFNEKTTRGICYLIYGEWPSSVSYYSGSRGTTVSYASTIWLDQLECTDSYYYGPQCRANYWGVNDCSHSEDVSIECTFPYQYETTLFYNQLTTARGAMAIAQGTNFRLNGHLLEVYHNGRWGTVCDDDFNTRTTRGICYLIYGVWPSTTRYYSGIGGTTDSYASTIWLDQLECTDSYYYGPQCRANYWGVNDCSHSEDVSIECNFYEVTTFDYWSSSLGGSMIVGQGINFRLYGNLLEVYHDGRWGTVCDDGFNEKTTRGICYLIYGEWPSSVSYYSGSRGTTVSYASTIWLDQLECTDSYYYGPQCRANYWGVNDCSHSEDVSIECTFPYQYETTLFYNQLTTARGAMAIAQGTNFRLNGHLLEVYHNGRWGTVCDDDFNTRTTRGICYLIYGVWPSEIFYRSTTRYYSGIGGTTDSYASTIWLDQLECTDSYYYGPQCRANYWGVNDCSHSEDVSIECNFYEIPSTVMSSAASHYSSDMYVSAISVGCYPDAWNIMIYLPELYKRHSDFDPSDIYLGRPGCQGYRVGNYLRIDQQYSNCQTHHFTTSNRVEYTNTLVYAYRDANYKFIIREYRFKIDVECDMSTHETVSQHFIQTHNQARTHRNNPHISSTGHYNIHMAFYRDSGYQQQMYGNPLTVGIGEDIYVSVTTPLSDYDVKMRVESCYTLPSRGAGNHLKYYLIQNGCNSDVNTHVIYLSSHETRFVFRDFEYSTNQDNLYLFCTATFCNVTDYSSVCDQSCHQVKRRSVQSASETLLRRAQTSDVLRLSKGRLRRDVGVKGESKTSGHAQYISIDDHLFIAVIVSAVGISVIAVFVAIRRYRKPRSKLVETI